MLWMYLDYGHNKTPLMRKAIFLIFNRIRTSKQARLVKTALHHGLMEVYS